MNSKIARFAQADLFLLAARLLAPPKGDRFAFDVDGNTLAEMCLAAGVDPAGEAGRAIGRALAAARAADMEAWAAEHVRLFEGSGVCPMNETVFVRRDKGAVLADVAGFYRAFGFRPAPRGEKEDYLVTELEYAAVLLAMLAEALRDGSAERAEVTMAALRTFVADHLGDWVPAFCRRLCEITNFPVLRESARALEALFNFLAREIGVPRSGSQEAHPEVDEDAPFTCGLAGEPAPGS